MKHHAPAALAAVAETPPRFDLYALVHKGLRAFLGDTLARLGRVDVDDAHDLAAALDALRELLVLWADHAAHEDRFIHPAMQARRPGSACGAAEQHVWHARGIEQLLELAARLEQAPAARRAPLAAQLYLEFSHFAAEGLEHLYLEETRHNPVLWEIHSDDELRLMHAAILEAVPVQLNAAYVRWIAPHVTPRERAALLAGMRQRAPLQVYSGVLALIRAHLPAGDWDKLASSLDAVPAQPLASIR